MLLTWLDKVLTWGSTGLSWGEVLHPSVNVAAGRKRRSTPRIWINLDGKRYHVTYREAAEIIERQAREDAKRRSELDKKKAKEVARKEAQQLKQRLVIEEPLPLEGFQPQAVSDRMFKDLREVYLDQMVRTLLDGDRLKRKIADEQAAMAAAEMLLMA